MSKVCPRCGANSNEKSFVGSFCESCASVNIRLGTPAKIELKECKICGKVWLREWAAKTRGALEEFIISKCRGEFANAHAKEITDEKAAIVFVVKKNNSFVEMTRNIPLEFRVIVCPECSKESGGYYEAIIQLRGEQEKAERLKNKLEKLLENKTFISKVVEDKNGLDVYVGSRRAVGETLAELDIRSTVSRKLFGIREGKRIYRTTYCVRV